MGVIKSNSFKEKKKKEKLKREKEKENHHITKVKIKVKHTIRILFFLIEFSASKKESD